LPAISGEIHSDGASLERYSSDMSGYHLRPQAVLLPEDEADLELILEHALVHRTPVTARGAGSNLSGSALSTGITVHFKRMSSIVDFEAHRVRVQPGVVYRDLNRMVQQRGVTLRYDVSSGGFSTVGGNVATKAGGLRSIKYGNADGSLAGVRLLCPAHGTVDTTHGLPSPLKDAVLSLRDRIREDGETSARLKMRRDLKSSSGYNLRAIIDHEDPAEITAHLMAGSVGTLGLFSELTMKLVPIPAYRLFFLAFFGSIPEAAAAAIDHIAPLRPSALEMVDAFGTDLIDELGVVGVPPGTGATLLVEFDDPISGGVCAAEKILARHARLHQRVQDEDAVERIWTIRWTMLTRIKRMHEDDAHRYLSFVDDMAVPPRRLVSFVTEILEVVHEERLPTVIFGHIGEGNLHIRPLIEREGWEERVNRVAERCFRCVLRHGGTLTAEHGSGRNRSPYLREEWGERIYGYFREIKSLFDPDDLLNPGVMFSNRGITEDLRF
jgi:FAD/FMN-containing dehydrogenase